MPRTPTIFRRTTSASGGSDGEDNHYSEENDNAADRPGSPIVHRRNRGVRPVGGGGDGDAVVARPRVSMSDEDQLARDALPTDDDMPPLPPSAMAAHANGSRSECDDDDDDADDELSVSAYARSSPNDRDDRSNAADDELTPKLRASLGRRAGSNDSPISLVPSEPSPVPVTLLGVGGDLRRKRIKKVSNYVLGPLLGEGIYGVVRDGLNLSGEKVTRCAVKMVATGASGKDHQHISNHASVPRTDDTSLKRSHREAHIREVVQAESVNLQRFHSKHIIRATDIFARYGKQYVVLPIAICSLEQLVDEAMRARRKDEDEEFGDRLKKRDARRRDEANGRGVLYREYTADEDDETTNSTNRTIDSYAGRLLDGNTNDNHRDNASSPMLDVASASLASGTFSNGVKKSLLLKPTSKEPLLPAMLIKGVMFQLLTGVEYLHSQRIAHNDIKASNLLLFESGTVRLSDLGSVSEHYNDKGTPICASPELCKYFYGMGRDGDGKSDDGQAPQVSAMACDMWCCGLVLYFLITGKPGPLPVQQAYYKHVMDKREKSTGGGSSAPVSRFQLYRQIAAQEQPVNLDDVPDLIVDSGVRGPTTADHQLGGSPALPGDAAHPGTSYAPNSVRHLLAALLEIDPEKRMTASAALLHPWVTLTFKVSAKSKHGSNATGNNSVGNGAPAARAPSRHAMEEAIQRDVARRVLQAPQVKSMIQMDRERHLQFVADCCSILDVHIPGDIVKASTAEPYDEDYESGGYTRDVSSEAFAQDLGPPQLQPPSAASVVTGTVVSPVLPERMPKGCVDVSLFLPRDEEDYYERKSGKTEFDVRVLRDQPLKVRQLEEYLHNVVMVQCGYRTEADPAYCAGTRAVANMFSGNTTASTNNNNTGLRANTSASNLVILSGSGHTTTTRGTTPGPPLRSPNSNAVAVMGVPQLGAVSSSDEFGNNQRESPESRARRYRGADAEGAEAIKESSKCLCGLV